MLIGTVDTTRSSRRSVEDMNTVHLTDAELALAKSAMTAYLRTFGHNEADTVDEIKHVIAKLNAADLESEDPVFLG